jgi:magnesium transporter
MVDALIAGVYGMNFPNMPELNWQYGYPFALSLMLIATATLFAIFRRLRWF